ncbi:MAG TPA: aminodeoxychorismate lyase [Povalibacter sp.]|uniref:aminodeoxychorismate lyase n=1 Tax=Povalibacter sp. TaxID=1962978 RepID=UPI002BF807F7|nr:aminodeoxychorismate lyase [Povalibacter sp.]HMN43305.1 aminodeoxychorismate lyase [Povalibacter sp.]
MSVAGLHNGAPIDDPAHALPVDDRGFNYGDGLFETMRLSDGKVRFLDAHLQRLQDSCRRLGIAFPAELSADIAILAAAHREGVLKIVITRGAGGRGYRPDPMSRTNRTLTVHPAPAPDKRGGLKLRWCDTRLSRNPALAGMKHLNRLEEVLAQNEWHDTAIDEGLLCDTEGELVSATAGNVFIVKGGALLTPDLRFCGVRGVMRAQVLRVALQLGVSCSEEPLWPHDLAEATEVFLTNAVRGIRPVNQLQDQSWETFPVAAQLSQALAL